MSKQWTPEQVQMLKMGGKIDKDATQEHIAYFNEICSRQGLDPFLGQAVLTTRSAKEENEKGVEQWVKKAQITTTIDGLRAIASRSGARFVVQRGFTPSERPNVPHSAYCELYLQGFDRPFREEVLYTELVQKTKAGSPKGVWATMPCQMLKKCAEAAVLRMAFPEASGLYIDDEMPSSENSNSRTEDRADNHQAPPVAKPTAVKPQPSLERVPVDKNFEEVKQALLRLAAAKGIKGGINGIKEATGMAEIATPDDYLLADEILRGKQGAA